MLTDRRAAAGPTLDPNLKSNLTVCTIAQLQARGVRATGTPQPHHLPTSLLILFFTRVLHLTLDSCDPYDRPNGGAHPGCHTTYSQSIV